MKILFALPAFNEEKDLPKLLDAFDRQMEVSHYRFQVVIVDDGSTDGTLSVIREWSSKMPIDVLQHAKNSGLGETIQDALHRSADLAEVDDVVVTMDADNTHSPTLIPAMVEAIQKGSDVVIASRYRRGSRVVGLSVPRHVMSWGARFLFQIAFPIAGVRDYTCGFRAYRASLLKNAFARYDKTLVQERGFAAMAEILLKLRTMNPKFHEVPMVLRYDFKSGDSKMRVGATVMKTLRMMRRLRSALPA
ncbi:MAG TPA: glycosyltransferase [Thermoanaerobaculia bacterium]|jgi:dolichol-phosphate mannosyltransferase